jgi:O-antigen ligase
VGFDGHATFLTVLADTGIFGGIPFYVLYVLICKTVSKLTGTCKKYYSVVILMFTLMGLTNPVHASMPLGFAAWFLAPLILITVLNKEEKQDAAL